jgi:nitrate reductase delta subunit
MTGTNLSMMNSMATATANIRSLKKSPEQLDALARVGAWTRKRFGLSETETVLVTELACGLPGCPPLETVVAFWTADARRHHFKIFKPVREIARDDLPFAWLKEALAVPDGFDCDCC